MRSDSRVRVWLDATGRFRPMRRPCEARCRKNLFVLIRSRSLPTGSEHSSVRETHNFIVLSVLQRFFLTICISWSMDSSAVSEPVNLSATEFSLV